MHLSEADGKEPTGVDRWLRILPWVLLGTAGWLGLGLLAARMLASSPPRAGFDLELLLVAGRRVAAGLSPYDPSFDGAAVQAESLFYSYPPPIGQLLAALATVPGGLILVLWGAGAVASLLLVGDRLARCWGPVSGTRSAGVSDQTGTSDATLSVRPVVRSRFALVDGLSPAAELVVSLAAIAPFIYPFSVALLFGNVDAWFPALFGIVLLGTIVPGRRWAIGAGIALAAMALVKLHPASLGAWLLVRGLRARRAPVDRSVQNQAPAGRLVRVVTALPAPWLSLAVAGITVGAIVAVSLALGGLGPWADWLALIRSGSAAQLVSGLNIGPASALALLIAGPSPAGESLARPLAIMVMTLAMLVTVFAAWRIDDAVESLTWATLASLVILPITWFHYPVALIPFAVAAWARARASQRARRTALCLGGAILVSMVAILQPVLVWVGAALVLIAVRQSAVGGTSYGVADAAPA